MTTFAYTVRETFHVVSCYTCGCKFGISDELHRRAVEDKKGSVYCPACAKGTCWTGETEAEKLRRQLKDEKAKRLREQAGAEQREAELLDKCNTLERSRRSERAAKTRIKNRVAAGVCPCCNRTFQNLARHMESKHPDYSSRGD